VLAVWVDYFAAVGAVVGADDGGANGGHEEDELWYSIIPGL
jgi:hypothetical protein